MPSLTSYGDPDYGSHPMGKAICLGKNYLDHAAEMKEAVPETPVLFLKPQSSCLHAQEFGQTLTAWMPDTWGSLHHECEIVLRVSKRGFRVAEGTAESYFDAVALGLDMTLRDLQAGLKKAGQPWEIAKAFPHSGLVGPWQKPEAGWIKWPFALRVDGQLRQSSDATQMRFSPAQALALASRHFVLEPGDLIFTGTPAGVGPVRDGSRADLLWQAKEQFSVRWDSKQLP